MEKQKTNILTNVADYYSAKLLEHGNTAKGVDWNGEDSQSLRFEQLSKIIVSEGAFSIADIGCGYGAYLEHLETRYDNFSYYGLDISREMIEAAKQNYLTREQSTFEVSSTPSKKSDYCIASGILNVRLHHNDEEWQEYFNDTLDLLDNWSNKGFAFNCLTSWSDEDKMRDNLFYANPGMVFDYCKKKYSKNVALLHDYDLYEFTILVRKA